MNLKISKLLDLEHADNSGVFLKITEQKKCDMGESSARTSHQDTVNVRQYDQLNVNPDEPKTAKQSDVLKKIAEHKDNKSIFEQPGKDKKLYPSEIKTLSVELSDDDVKLESMALELQQGGLVTVGGQKVILDEAVAQGLLPEYTAIKLMEKAGLFGGFLDINACKSQKVEDVMQEGLLDDDLMACVLHSEKILAGVFDVEHGRHCSIKDAAEAGLLDSDTAARLLEAQVVSGGIFDLQRDKKISVTLAANLGLIEEGSKEKLLALEKSCRGKCSDPNAVQTKLALQLQMNGVVDPKTKKGCLTGTSPSNWLNWTGWGSDDFMPAGCRRWHCASWLWCSPCCCGCSTTGSHRSHSCSKVDGTWKRHSKAKNQLV